MSMNIELNDAIECQCETCFCDELKLPAGMEIVSMRCEEDDYHEDGYRQVIGWVHVQTTGGELTYRNGNLHSITHVQGNGCVCHLVDPDVRKMCMGLGFDHDDIMETALDYHSRGAKMACICCSSIGIIWRDQAKKSQMVVFDRDGAHRSKHPIDYGYHPHGELWIWRLNGLLVQGPLYQYEGKWMILEED